MKLGAFVLAVVVAIGLGLVIHDQCDQWKVLGSVNQSVTRRALRQEVARLRTRVAELERRLPGEASSGDTSP